MEENSQCVMKHYSLRNKELQRNKTQTRKEERIREMKVSLAQQWSHELLSKAEALSSH